MVDWKKIEQIRCKIYLKKRNFLGKRLYQSGVLGMILYDLSNLRVLLGKLSLVFFSK